MAHAGRPATKLQITDAERAELKVRLRVRKAPEDEKLRMRIVLGCAEPPRVLRRLFSLRG